MYRIQQALRDRLIYRVLLSTDRGRPHRRGQKDIAHYGHGAPTEIKTRRKREIEYFLDPFRTYVSKALRER